MATAFSGTPRFCSISYSSGTMNTRNASPRQQFFTSRHPPAASTTAATLSSSARQSSW